jgi:hypothetical protein
MTTSALMGYKPKNDIGRMRVHNGSILESFLRQWQPLVPALAALLLAGCASAAYHKGNAAARSMDAAAADVRAESNALDAAMSSLDDLINKPAPDLKPQLTRFSDSLDRLAAAAKRAEDSGRRMGRKNAAYFADWDKQLAAMKFDAVRTSSQAHETEVTNHVETVNHRYLETESVAEPLISYLQDIRAALRADLTLGGLEAVKTVVNTAGQNADKLKSVFAQLAAELSTSSTSMSSVTTTTAQNTQNTR